MTAPIVIADSITRVGPEAVGAVVVNASHGGVYAAYLAVKLHAAAAIFNDAAVGRDRAGIGGLDYLEDFGIAAATVGHDTAQIGDGADMMARGVITHANRPAASLGVSPGQSCSAAATLLQQARQAHRASPEALEAAFLLIAETPQVWALDSASLVLPEHKDAIVATGSHGALLGGKPETAIKIRVFAALYNDADFGIDDAGIRACRCSTRAASRAPVSAPGARASATGNRPIATASSAGVNAPRRAARRRDGIGTRELVARLRRAAA